MARSRALRTAVWLGVGALALAVLVAEPLSLATGAATITTNLTGPELFALTCASCHGLSGRGRVFSVGGQKIEVPAITYTRLSQVYTQNFDEQLRGTIVKGVDEQGKALNLLMPRWTMLSAADVDKLLAYIKTLR